MSLFSTTRRKFLLVSGALGLGVVVGGYVSWRNAKESDIVVAILKRRLPWIKVDDGVFEQYSLELVEERRNFKKQLRILSTFAPLATLATPYSLLPMKHPLRRIENYTVSNFLLSTDFFQNGADENKPVQYFGFYSAYKRPCANFFNS